MPTPQRNDDKKNSNVLLSLAAVLLFVASALPPAAASADSVDIERIMQLYGFDSAEKIRALDYLVKRAHPDMNITLRSIFNDFSHDQAIMDSVIKFLDITQEKFVVRKHNQERWDIGPQSWMELEPEAIRAALVTLGFVNEIQARNQHPDLIVILGATYFRMVDRISYVNKLIAKHEINSPSLLLLAGQRPAKIDVDGSKEWLNNLAERLKVPADKIMETDLIKLAFEHSKLKAQYEPTVIDGQALNGGRPTTQSTITELSRWLSLNPKKTVTLVSNQPNVAYQDAIIQQVLSDTHCESQAETIGSAAGEKVAIHSLVEGLGSTLFARTPKVLLSLKLKSENEASHRHLQELYGKQPLMYQGLDNLFEHATPKTLRPK